MFMPREEYVPAEDFEGAFVIVPGRLVKHYYKSITLSEKGENQ